MNWQIYLGVPVAERRKTLVGRPCCVGARRNRWPFQLFRVWAPVAIASALLLQPQLSSAAAFDYNDSGWEGTSELLKLVRAKLGVGRVQLTASIDYAKLTPRDALLVLHPTVALRHESMNEFMGQGGRIAVIDDYGSAGAFFEQYEIRRLNSPIQPALPLRGNANLAWAYPSVDASGEALVHPMVDGLQRILTNHPVVLSGSSLTPVLEIRSQQGEKQVLAYAGVIGRRGRLFAMGDPSALINLMLRYPENRQFAEQLVSYLVENDDWGSRGGQLYLVSNEFSQTNSADGDIFSQRSAENLWVRGRELLKRPLPESTQWILGLLTAILVGRWAWSLVIRSLRPAAPRFAVPVPLTSKPGESGRAAVLAAGTTPRALALLELDSGMQRYILAELDLDGTLDRQALFEAVAAAGLLDVLHQSEVGWYSALVKKVQSALVAGHRTRVTESDLSRAHRLILDIASRINHRRTP
jgi:hypothetical protein